MGKPLIVVGDKTDHGGVVVTGSSITLVDGKPVACLGDVVACPRGGHGGDSVIVTATSGIDVDGRMAACHGDKTSCGATLLSGQVSTTAR